ncbi:MAG: OmpA family protein, partial [Saprospiraceae bacterium]|nr:OmpA family protein [Saprospiraceae bacterium]
MHTKPILLFMAVLCCFGFIMQAQQGLTGEYYNGQNFEQKVVTRRDAQINFAWNNDAPPAPGVNPNVFSVRWTGKIKSPEAGTYVFRAHVDDGIRVKVNGQMVINAWGLHDSEKVSGRIRLEANREYDLVVEYFNALREGEIQVFWQLPSEAPVFGGTLGYNDHLIDGRFFVAPARPVSNVTPPKPRPATPTPAARPIQTPPKKPATPPAKPVVKPAVKPTPIAKDTLEKYIPKNIFFVKSKSEMLPESTPELDRLAGFLVRYPKYRLTVDGHTDHVGNSAKNLELSQERAQTVASYLTQKGVAATRITAKGYGDTRPLIKEPENQPNAKNRRVAFTIQE